MASENDASYCEQCEREQPTDTVQVSAGLAADSEGRTRELRDTWRCCAVCGHHHEYLWQDDYSVD